MQKPIVHNNQFIGLTGFALFLLFSACTPYKYGYWQKLESSDRFCLADPDSVAKTILHLAERKNKLNEQARQISGQIQDKLSNSQLIPLHSFNLLFENLQQQYGIDTVFQEVLQQSRNQSIREYAKNELLESALTYKNEFGQNKFLRRIINRGDVAYNIKPHTLDQTQHFLWSDNHFRNYLTEHKHDEPAPTTKAGYVLSGISDHLNEAEYKTEIFFSRIFGHVAGAFHGKIDKEFQARALKSNLQEFDLVFLKSVTHLTEKFIPGYFGHVGIYLGNDQMIEAPRCGVRICSTEEFSEGEIFLVLRPLRLTEIKKEYLRKAIRNQKGKKYDFTFDAQSPDRVVCTELVCLIYDFIDWQFNRRAGRYTISPDDLIKSLLARNDFSFELYINKGEVIHQPDIALIQDLLTQN
ncbi:MAG: YiiX/YebB-like N1pC/P60 family cysteine hydrolase [Prolixibacteraceae bacterium]